MFTPRAPVGEQMSKCPKVARVLKVSQIRKNIFSYPWGVFKMGQDLDKWTSTLRGTPARDITRPPHEK